MLPNKILNYSVMTDLRFNGRIDLGAA